MSFTPTLLRVKRRITEDPTDIFVLSSKRLKSSSEGEIKITGLNYFKRSFHHEREGDFEEP